MTIKPVDHLTVSDLRAHPVWRYTTSDDFDETAVRPVRHLPVGNLTGKLVGTRVTLASKDNVWALLGNVDTNNPRLTEHFLIISVHANGRWFALSRYHDIDYLKNGPNKLAQFLEMSVEDIFPISYDIRKYATGHAAALSGQILREPRERLTRAQIVALAVP